MISANELPVKESVYDMPAVPHGQQPTPEQQEQAMTAQIAATVVGVAAAKAAIQDAVTNQIVALLKSADLLSEAGIKAFAKIAAKLVRNASRKSQELTWVGVKKRASIVGVPFNAPMPKTTDIPKELRQGRTSNLESAYARLAKEYQDNLKRTPDDPVIQELVAQYEEEGISPLPRPDNLSSDAVERIADGKAEWAESFAKASQEEGTFDPEAESDEKISRDSLAERRRRAREEQAKELERFNAEIRRAKGARATEARDSEAKLRADRAAALVEEANTFTLSLAEREAVVERYALQKAGERAERMVSQDISGAARNIYKIAIDNVPNNAVVGYRRVVHPELSKSGQSCGLCIVASTMEYKKSDLLPIHSGCNCETCEIYSKDGYLYDPGHIINMEDLEVFYREAKGSTHGWDLKKSRYEVVNHPEYGPTLVNAHPNKTGKIKKEYIPTNG